MLDSESDSWLIVKMHSLTSLGSISLGQTISLRAFFFGISEMGIEACLDIGSIAHARYFC